MKKHFRFLSLVALLTATALTSCQKEEWEMDSPFESESELDDEGTRATYEYEYETSSNYLKLSQECIQNPEKGFYKQYNICFDVNATGMKEDGETPKDTDWALKVINGKAYPKKKGIYGFERFDKGRLILLQISLQDYLNENLTDTALTSIADLLDDIRIAKKKAIVRFCYSLEDPGSIVYKEGANREASLTQIISHINQIAPILQKYKDVLYIFQAGFIGTWGEWYYISEPEFNMEKNGFNFRKDVITQMLSALPDRMIAVRTPKFKRQYLHEKSDYKYELNYYEPLSSPNTDGKLHKNANGRLTFYHDAFMCDNNQEKGTFVDQIDRDMWLKQSAFLAVGGETANSNGTDQDIIDNVTDEKKGAIKRIKDYHMSYIHYRTNSDLFQAWQNARMTIDNKKVPLTDVINNALGYRLWLTNFKTIGNYKTGGTVYFKFSIKNNGAAPVIYNRPMSLVLLDNNNNFIKVLASSVNSKKNLFVAKHQSQTTNYASSSEVADIRKIAPGQYKFFTCKVNIDKKLLKSGYKVALWMPDQSSSLQQTPEYSIRLCNQELGDFDWVNGYNVLYKIR